MSLKKKFAWVEAACVAKWLTETLRPCTRAMTFAGSLRRRCSMVSDIEFLYIPKFGPVQDGLFQKENADLFEWRLSELLEAKILVKRESDKGNPIGYGPRNKYLVHRQSGLPVDVFRSDDLGWWSYLVCRTGPKDSNIAIAQGASARGLHWDPYRGFYSPSSGWIHPKREEEVFRIAGLPFKEPQQR